MSSPVIKADYQLKASFNTAYPLKVDLSMPPSQSHEKSIGLGENGKPVIIDVEKLTAEELSEYKTSSKNITLNVFVTDRISVRRYLPDTRKQECKRVIDSLPDTSVIITFHNEVYSLLLRSIHSIIDRSDPKLIREIILVDDASDYDYVNGKLQSYISYLKKVKLIQLKKRHGLIRARLIGVKEAQGETLTFLDSHIECLPGWLEPLLEQIKLNKTRVVEPDLINISSEDFHLEYKDMPWVGVFNWKLEFGWDHPIEELEKNGGNRLEPIKDAALVGGVFAIDRKYFEKLGYWDDQLQLYGFENMELSFKIWMCHGSIYKVPCSLVGHAFHNRKIDSWKSDGEVLKRNRDRVAEVWMDDYKEFVYQRTGPKSEDLGEIQHLIERRINNKCHDFDWYMANVCPTYVNPKHSIHQGVLRNPSTNLCIIPDRTLIVVPCTKPHKLGKSVIFSSAIWDMSIKGEISTESSCMYYQGTDINLYSCYRMNENKFFSYDNITLQIQILGTVKNCITMDGTGISLKLCDETKNNQKFVWGHE